MKRFLVLVAVCAVLGAPRLTAAAQTCDAPATSDPLARARAVSAQLAPEQRAQAQALLYQAFELFKAGEFEAAVLGFQKALAIDPANGLGHYNLAETYTRQNKMVLAQLHYQRTIEFAPNSKEALIAQTWLGPPPRNVMVPAGEFWMGSDDGGSDEKPRHRVYLDAFCIDKFAVTNALYGQFILAAGRPAPSYWNDAKWNGPSQPVVGVTWHDADAYCKWAGKRLPTEAEWEKAARGTDSRTYPWGDRWDVSKANSDESKLGKTVAVGSYPGGASPYGVHDMAGNVWEWVADWYDKDYYQRSPERNPPGPNSGTRKALRGGSWNGIPLNLRSASRGSEMPALGDDLIGFRCARGTF